MKDISDVFDHYRISARAVWNTAFWPDVDLRDWDSVARFDDIQRILFSELVLNKLSREWPLEDIFENPIPFIHVVPSINATPIMIQNPRPDKPRGYWDHPINRISPGAAVMHFLAYFDFDRLDYADLRYYLVKIKKFDSQLELVDREALIERQHANVFLTEE